MNNKEGTLISVFHLLMCVCLGSSLFILIQKSTKSIMCGFAVTCYPKYMGK